MRKVRVRKVTKPTDGPPKIDNLFYVSALENDYRVRMSNRTKAVDFKRDVIMQQGLTKDEAESLCLGLNLNLIPRTQADSERFVYRLRDSANRGSGDIAELSDEEVEFIDESDGHEN